MIVFLLFLFLTFCNCIDSIADSFYIFDVGQGNCQLAIFEKEGIGILYDCGSSNLGKPAKFIPKIEENKWRAIYHISFFNLSLPGCISRLKLPFKVILY